MKKLTTLTFILFTSCMNHALANVHYTCREAITNNKDGYIGMLVPDGAVLQVSAPSTEVKKVKIDFLNQGKMKTFKASVVLPEPHTHGLLGQFVRHLKGFYLSFYVIPDYQEANTQQKFKGGSFLLNHEKMFMLCDSEIEELFWFEECFTSSCR